MCLNARKQHLDSAALESKSLLRPLMSPGLDVVQSGGLHPGHALWSASSNFFSKSDTALQKSRKLKDDYHNFEV